MVVLVVAIDDELKDYLSFYESATDTGVYRVARQLKTRMTIYRIF